MVNANWPTAVASEADIVSTVLALAFHIGGPNGVNPDELALVYGSFLSIFKGRIWLPLVKKILTQTFFTALYERTSQMV